ncbi:hypothetical protein M752DRAFT_99856 [Aspergillus phoenicis ATCC 13157]|uniref:Uncharacterized protein n=1 Tax=Aspergillus phoenicis ATCC 13157 TaxID=1353007 RepID=A0A370PVP4_ASPPH|nr:hypothetical protein M752DRAFT_99856 [Aspergillus phoenicis ATCC 13157]
MNWEGLSGHTIGPVHDLFFRLETRHASPWASSYTFFPLLFFLSHFVLGVRECSTGVISLLVILLDIFPLF